MSCVQYICKIWGLLMNSYIKIQWCWKISVVCRHEVKLLQTLKRHFYKLDYIKGIMILDSYCWKRYQWKGNWWQYINLLIRKTTIWRYISPFLLSEIVEHHLDETNTATAKQIKDNIYERDINGKVTDDNIYERDINGKVTDDNI